MSRTNDFRVLRHKQDIYTNPLSPREDHERKIKDGKSSRVGRNAMRCCLPGTTWPGNEHSVARATCTRPTYKNKIGKKEMAI